jgi:hypothetical protein
MKETMLQVFPLKRSTENQSKKKMESKKVLMRNVEMEKEKKKKKKSKKKQSGQEDGASVVSIDDSFRRHDSELRTKSGSDISRSITPVCMPNHTPKKKKKKKRNSKVGSAKLDGSDPSSTLPVFGGLEKKKKQKKKRVEADTLSIQSTSSGDLLDSSNQAKKKTTTKNKREKKCVKKGEAVKQVIAQRKSVIENARRSSLNKKDERARKNIGSSKKEESRALLSKADKISPINKMKGVVNQVNDPQSRNVAPKSSFQRKTKLFGTNRSNVVPVTPGEHLDYIFKPDKDKKQEKEEEIKTERRSLMTDLQSSSPRQSRSRISKNTHSISLVPLNVSSARILKVEANKPRSWKDRTERSSRSASPGKYRQLYLKQVKSVESDEEDKEKISSISPALEKPALAKEKYLNSEKLCRSTSPGKYQRLYLKQVKRIESDDEDKKERRKPGAMQRRVKSSETFAAIRHPSSKVRSPPRSSTLRSRSASPGKYRHLYLKQVKSVESDDEDKSEKIEGRKMPSNVPKTVQMDGKRRKSHSSGSHHDGVMQYLGVRIGKEESSKSLISPPRSPKHKRIDAFATPYNIKERLSRKERISDHFERTTRSGVRTLSPKPVRRALNALNLATPAPQRNVIPKPKNLKMMLTQESVSFADSVVGLLKNKSKKGKVTKLCNRIQDADGLPITRRLSMRDNDLVCDIINAIQNDPDVTEIVVDQDAVLNTVSTTLLFQFISALQMNFHVKRLVFKGVQLGNDVLYALATSMETNFVIEEIDLSQNLFTSEGLAEFCQVLGRSNKACKSINLRNQTTPISIASEMDVLDAFNSNKILKEIKVDFNSEEGKQRLEDILQRNRKVSSSKNDFDKMLIELLEYEAERAEAMMELRKAENEIPEVPEDDWDYMFELALLFDKYKLKDVVEASKDSAASKNLNLKNADSLSKTEKSNFLFGQFKDILDDSIGCFNSDGSFLTAEFISKYLKKTQDTEELVFDFHGQWKLFKRFPMTDPAREVIVTKFVDAIVCHPKMKEFMGINMANTGCGDDFLEKLAERCLADPKLLPNIHMINFETNFINEKGCVSLSKIISSRSSMRYLQLVRLENQKALLTSKAEFALAKSMFVNRSVVVVSLHFRNLLERQQIEAYVSRNVDFLRQARQQYYKKTGTGRARNETEIYFDKIASNNSSIKKVDLSGNRKFLSLSKEETIKAARAFAKNTHVKSINMNACELDDDFAEAIGKSLKTNKTIEKLHLENNAISGDGIRCIFEGVARNSSLLELRLHKQSKAIVTSEEDPLADILEPNNSLIKLGIDLRAQNAQVKVDRFLKLNDRKKRVGTGSHDADEATYMFG